MTTLETIDPDEFTPRLVVLLSNAVSWLESSEMRRRFGLGTNDWRVLSTVALRPGATLTEVAEFIGVTKAMVSRSVTVLTDRELVTLSGGPRGSRPMHLTEAGAEVHHGLLRLDRAVESVLVDGMSEAEVRSLNQTLRQMIARIRTADLSDLDHDNTNHQTQKARNHP